MLSLSVQMAPPEVGCAVDIKKNQLQPVWISQQRTLFGAGYGAGEQSFQFFKKSEDPVGFIQGNDS